MRCALRRMGTFASRRPRWARTISIIQRSCLCSIGAVALCAIAITARADGPGAYRPRADAPAATSEQNAIDEYNAGYALIQRAEHAENLAAASSNETDRSAAVREAQEAYRASLKEFTAATRFDSSMHEAYTYLGYANRKLGHYPEALRAYEQALRINPDYSHAIEYQGEALLGLNRVDAARFNYLRLYALDQRQASKLFLAMESWLAANKGKPPAGVDVEALQGWIAERAASSERDAQKRAVASW
jgi:tetratricopeptide (TPR) repeat protein